MQVLNLISIKLFDHMNKIKPQVSPYEQFSPWEQSFINLVSSFNPSATRNKPMKRQYLTIDSCKVTHNNEKLNVSKKQMGRTIMNLSKINLRSSSSKKQQQLIILQKSTRYQGPRITFYSKMNPNCSERSKSYFTQVQNKSLRNSFYDQSNSFIRDRSIKYLDIHEENIEPKKPREFCKYLRSIYPVKDDKNCFIYPRKKDENHHMRRLKILAENRKLSQQH